MQSTRRQVSWAATPAFNESQHSAMNNEFRISSVQQALGSPYGTAAQDTSTRIHCSRLRPASQCELTNPRVNQSRSEGRIIEAVNAKLCWNSMCTVPELGQVILASVMEHGRCCPSPRMPSLRNTAGLVIDENHLNMLREVASHTRCRLWAVMPLPEMRDSASSVGCAFVLCVFFDISS